MTLVVDASIVFRWVFKSSSSAEARAVLRRSEPLIAPELIIAELANAAWKTVQFEGFDPEDARRRLDDAIDLLDEVVPCASLADRAFEIAVDLRHAVYDCFYLALAEARSCRAATLDVRLARRCGGTRYATLLPETI
ncbi:type II toxin-antitoxin system VapC family toxin [Rhodoplanes sp. SY1]|uniref:type II toxin-antitoxin system VapC family toxin n=1 Tax=Rhodoplanes sp. SY1 TaxID=3166646 RepID=UPI0038B54DEF